MYLASKGNVKSLMLLFKSRLIYLRDTAILNLKRTDISEEEIRSRLLELSSMAEEINDINESIMVIKALRNEI